MGGSAIRSHAGRNTVSLPDMLGGENLLGISVDDSREKVITKLGYPKRQDILIASGYKNFKYNDVEIVFERDGDLICHIVLYGKGRRGRFRLPWFVKDRGRIRRDIRYERMVRFLQINEIEYSIGKSVGENDRRIYLKNGEIIFFEYEDGIFSLYGIYLKMI